MKLKAFFHRTIMAVGVTLMVSFATTSAGFAKSDPSTALSPDEEKHIETMLNQDTDMGNDPAGPPALDAEEGEYPLPDENDPSLEDPSGMGEDDNSDLEPNPDSEDSYEHDAHPGLLPEDEENPEYDNNYEEPTEEPMAPEDEE